MKHFLTAGRSINIFLSSVLINSFTSTPLFVPFTFLCHTPQCGITNLGTVNDMYLFLYFTSHMYRLFLCDMWIIKYLPNTLFMICSYGFAFTHEKLLYPRKAYQYSPIADITIINNTPQYFLSTHCVCSIFISQPHILVAEPYQRRFTKSTPFTFTYQYYFTITRIFCYHIYPLLTMTDLTPRSYTLTTLLLSAAHCKQQGLAAAFSSVSFIFILTYENQTN